jgi:hypothetical protein
MMLRRHFVNTLLSSGIVATAASIIYPILKFVIPPETAESAVLSVTAGRLDDVQPNTGRIFQFGGERVLSCARLKVNCAHFQPDALTSTVPFSTHLRSGRSSALATAASLI